VAAGGSRQSAQMKISVEELMLSQGQPGTRRTARHIAQETEMLRSMMFDIIHKDLKLICFKKKRTRDLAEVKKLSRLICAKSY